MSHVVPRYGTGLTPKYVTINVRSKRGSIAYFAMNLNAAGPTITAEMEYGCLSV